jgi:hypothetical protein
MCVYIGFVRLQNSGLGTIELSSWLRRFLYIEMMHVRTRLAYVKTLSGLTNQQPSWATIERYSANIYFVHPSK